MGTLRRRRVGSSVRRAALSLCGVVALGVFVQQAGAAAILAHFERLGFSFVYLLLVALSWRCLGATAMWWLFPRDRGPSWWQVFVLRTAGESLNVLTPLAGLGGEPVKAFMLRRHLRDESSAGYVLLDKTLFFLASVLFMLSGLLLAVTLLEGHRVVALLAQGLTLLWCGLLVLLMSMQARGTLVSHCVRVASLLGVRARAQTHARLREVDSTLQRAYRERPGRLLGALVLHFAGRAARSVDVWLCALWLGLPLSFGPAYVVAAAGTLAGAVFAFIPGALGAYEGGHAYVLVRFGMDMAGGMALGLVRHLRNWVLAGIGYVLLVVHLEGRDAQPPEPSADGHPLPLE